MGWRLPFSRAERNAKPGGQGRTWTKRQVTTAVTFVLTALISVLTGIESNHPSLGFGIALTIFVGGGAVLVALQQDDRELAAAAVPRLPVGEVICLRPAADNRYGSQLAAVPAAATLAVLLAPVGGRSAGPVFDESTETGSTGSLINRLGERELLSRALRTDRACVIVVSGPSGVGKSALVAQVLLDEGLNDAKRQHNLPGDEFDAWQLFEDIAQRRSPRARLRDGGDVLASLIDATEAPTGGIVPIVVDGAQHLFDPDSHTMISLELAEALGIAATGRRRVKVILVVQDSPVRQPGSEWLARAEHIRVGGLTREDFGALLARLEVSRGSRGAELRPADRDQLHDSLRGIPRLAELFRAVLALPGYPHQAAWLTGLLAEHPPDESERVLALEMVGSLDGPQRRVLAGLAAYGMPVTSEQLRDLLGEEFSPDRVTVLLTKLVDAQVISKTGDRYDAPTTAIKDAVTHHDPDGYSSLLLRASDLLSVLRESREVKRLADLAVYFAELNILIRTRVMWGAAYELADQLEELLQRWNAAGLLLRYREAIAGQLGEGYQDDEVEKCYPEIVNYNALGCIYLQRGDFGQAQRAFDNALRYADAVKARWPRGRQKVFINLAVLYWESGRTVIAERHYRDALELAEADHDAGDQMAALAGLADCARRHYDHGAAIRRGMQALRAAQAVKSSWSADIAVKLARWHSELGQPEDAFRLLDLANSEAGLRDDPALRARCLDGRADLLLNDNDLPAARDFAQQALTGALRLNGPVTVLQARTTMAMVYLRLGDVPAADREIERAARYRREGGSLLILAMQALIAFQLDPDGIAAGMLFEKLEREAVRRRERDARDYAAWDLEGLAICGSLVGGSERLDPAVKAFRRARTQIPVPPVLNARMEFWLGIIAGGCAPGRMDPVLAAVTDRAAGGSG